VSLTSPGEALPLTSPRDSVSLTSSREGVSLTSPRDGVSLTSPLEGASLTSPVTSVASDFSAQNLDAILDAAAAVEDNHEMKPIEVWPEAGTVTLTYFDSRH
jgi:hypothetical protein